MSLWSNGRSPGAAAPTTPSVGAFGKIPNAADFVHLGPVDPDTQQFRAWLEDGVSWASTRQPDFWRVAQGDMRVFGFVLRAASGNLIVGAMRPSSDAVGRNFPISAYVALPGGPLNDRPHLLPLSFGDVLQHAAEAVLADDVPGAVNQFQGALSDGRLLPFSSLDDDAREYAEWSSATLLNVALDALFGTESRACAIQAVHTIREAILPFYGKDQPKTPLSVRVPLGGSGAGAAAFWLDVVRHAAGWRETVPTFFWSFQDGRGEAIIQLGEVPPSSLSALWLADPNSDHMCDLTHLVPTAGANFLALLPPAIAGTFMREDARVVDLLNAFQS